MRAARLFLGLSASFAVIASVASGCGSSTSNPPVDSGTGEDVTMEAAPMEAAVEAAPEAAPVEAGPDGCVPDASIQNLTIPDASIGDSGVDVPACLSCFETNCMSIVATCDQSCVCVSAVQQFATCIGMAGSSLLTCAAGLEAIPGVSIQQLACALPCATPCGVSLTGDSGMADSSSNDSATTTDGPTE
jgi:hypothetical protein